MKQLCVTAPIPPPRASHLRTWYGAWHLTLYWQCRGPAPSPMLAGCPTAAGATAVLHLHRPGTHDTQNHSMRTTAASATATVTPTRLTASERPEHAAGSLWAVQTAVSTGIITCPREVRWLVHREVRIEVRSRLSTQDGAPDQDGAEPFRAAHHHHDNSTTAPRPQRATQQPCRVRSSSVLLWPHNTVTHHQSWMQRASQAG